MVGAAVGIVVGVGVGAGVDGGDGAGAGCPPPHSHCAGCALQGHQDWPPRAHGRQTPSEMPLCVGLATATQTSQLAHGFSASASSRSARPNMFFVCTRPSPEESVLQLPGSAAATFKTANDEARHPTRKAARKAMFADKAQG